MPADLTPYLPRLLIDWEREAPAATTRAIEGSLVFLDISGFTSMSERLARHGRVGAEEVTGVIDATFERLLPAAYADGGSLLKFGGDAMLLFFPGDGHAVRACRAAHAMRALLRDQGRFRTSAGWVALRMSVGVGSGPVCFVLAGQSHRELVVLGATVTSTLAMESAAAAGQILLSEATTCALPSAAVGASLDGGVLLRRAPPADWSSRAKTAPVLGEEPERYIPLAIRRHLASGILESEHRTATIGFIHFDGTDERIAREGLVAVAPLVDELVRVAQQAADELDVSFVGTDVDRDGGKMILAAGAPLATGDDEQRMLRALRRIIDAKTELVPRVGVHRGAIFAGDVGPAYRRTYTVMGDAVNLAARLMARAAPGQILATADVCDRSRTAYVLAPVDPFQAKGKRKPVVALSVGEPVAGAVATRASRLPLAGREREMHRIEQALARVREGRHAVVEVTGEPGIGKSRVVEELVARAGAMPCHFGICEQYESSSPYFPFRRFLRSAVGIDANEPPPSAWRVLQERVQATAPEVAEWLSLIADAMGIATPPSAVVTSLEPRFRKARLHQAITHLLRAVVTGPTIFVFEDTQWADLASRDLLGELIANAHGSPWLFCITHRPGEDRLAPADESGFALNLQPLSAEASLAVTRAAMADRELPAHQVAALAQRAGGNPLFLDEIIASASEGRDLDALPDTVEALLTARVDHLAPAERRLLRYAAVLGPAFDLESLAAVGSDVLPHPTDSVIASLAEFVAPDAPGSYRFRHALVREVAYQGLPFRVRRRLHERIGLEIERRGAAHADASAEILSLHFHTAQSYEKSLRYSQLAAQRSKERFANVEAAEFFRRAIEAARHTPAAITDGIAGMLEALGDVSELSGAYEEAADAYSKARRAATAGEAPPRLLRKEGIIRERRGQYGDALRWYSRALRDLGPSERADRVELSLAYAGVRFRQGRYAECARVCAGILTDAEAAGNRAGLAHAYYLLSHAYALMGNLRADAYRDLALPIYEELGDLVGQANVLNNLGVRAYYEGKWDDALQLYQRSKDARERAGDVVGSATASNNIGEILSDQGRLDEATALFEEALRTWRGARYPIGVALARSNLGRAAVRAGRLKDAEQLLHEALDGFREIRAESYVVETEARIAELYLARGDYAAALHRIDTTLQRRDLTGLVALEAMIYRIRGSALTHEARLEEARAALDESARLARSIVAEYELALTLHACADHAERSGGDPSGFLLECSAIFERLGIRRYAAIGG